MAKLTMTSFMTLDGVMQAPGGPGEDTSGGFTHGGWFIPLADPAFGEFIVGVFGRAGAFLLGRRTFQIFAGHWPRITDPDDPVAGPLNRLPKYVASRTLEQLEWRNSTLLEGDVAEAIAGLKAEDGDYLLVIGSSGLLQTLLRHDLVDTFTIWTFPVVLGTGKRLFGDGAVPAGLRLSGVETASTGVTVATYERAGEIAYGSFALEE